MWQRRCIPQRLKYWCSGFLRKNLLIPHLECGLFWKIFHVHVKKNVYLQLFGWSVLYVSIGWSFLMMSHALTAFFFLTVLLRCNSKSIQFTHIKYPIQWFFSKFTGMCSHSQSVLQHFCQVTKKPCTFLGVIPTSPLSTDKYRVYLCLYRFSYFGFSYEYNILHGLFWLISFT